MQYSILGVSNIMLKYRGIFQGHLSLPFRVGYTTGKKKKRKMGKEKKKEGKDQDYRKILKRLQRGKIKKKGCTVMSKKWHIRRKG
jgi:hypothetical protein